MSKSSRIWEKDAAAPDGYKRIKLITVYDVKHDGRHKTRIIAGGHLTTMPTESVYSGVVSLTGIRLLVFLAELNGLQSWVPDTSSAYLQAKMKERLYVIAGCEFGDLEGHTLVIHKVLCRLRTSGVRWHERLTDCLRHMASSHARVSPIFRCATGRITGFSLISNPNFCAKASSSLVLFQAPVDLSPFLGEQTAIADTNAKNTRVPQYQCRKANSVIFFCLFD